MGRINHHLNDELLMAYASGNLPEAFNLVVASHVSLCDECRARLASFEEVGGALLDNLSVGNTPVDLDAVMSRIELDPTPAESPAAAASDGIFPAPLQDYVGGDLSAVKWRPIGMGVKQAILPTSKSASVRLLSIPPGAMMPDHGHRGTELTLVLQGAFRDEADFFARGDIEVADESDQHTPIADEGEVCICLAATDAPLRFQGILPRIVQRFARI